MSTRRTKGKTAPSGRKLCDLVVKQRIKTLRQRATVLAKASLAADIDYSRVPPRGLVQINAASKGLVLGIGDSWFDYFSMDVFDSLENDLSYNARSLASAGTSLKQIVNNPAQLRALSREIEKTVGGAAPMAILVSGGGNDMIDFGLGSLLNDYGVKPPLIENRVQQLIDTEIKDSLTAIVDAITGLCKQWLGRTIPILIHGYAYPIPDGRYLAFPRRGPWLEPAFLAKFYPKSDLKSRTAVMVTLIDRLNEMMIKKVAGTTGREHVEHVELRHTLDADDYTTMWDNELHPTYEGFQLIADAFAAKL